MEGCTAFDNTTGDITTTLFVKDNVVMGKCTIEIDGIYKTERWYNAVGKFHRDGQPAIILYKDDKIIEQQWYKDDMRQPEPKPKEPKEPTADILARIHADLATVEARLAEISQ